jgi:2-C-methyl-D-erythritol 4-phosphate cytidylyltransferase
MIADVVSAAYANRAASAGCTSVDTLKRVSVDGYITETIDRSEVYRAQTPQVFDCNLYRAAVYSAGKDGILATDDNMLVERLGQTVKMVNTGEENIKITTAIDFAVAQAILEARATK